MSVFDRRSMIIYGTQTGRATFVCNIDFLYMLYSSRMLHYARAVCLPSHRDNNLLFCTYSRKNNDCLSATYPSMIHSSVASCLCAKNNGSVSSFVHCIIFIVSHLAQHVIGSKNMWLCTKNNGTVSSFVHCIMFIVFHLAQRVIGSGKFYLSRHWQICSSIFRTQIILTIRPFGAFIGADSHHISVQIEFFNINSWNYLIAQPETGFQSIAVSFNFWLKNRVTTK